MKTEFLVLTTPTEHHDYFLNKINLNKKDTKVIFELKKIKFPYKIKNKFYFKNDEIEKKFFKNKNFKSKFKIYTVNDLNNKKTINLIKSFNPKNIIVFGTSILKKNFLKSFETSKIVNLHGGNPEEYRGLDSLFWSIFHKDFKNLQTTLHYVKLRVDTGNIIKKLKIITNKKTNLYNLRILNVINCIKITNFYIKKILDKKKIITF